jgi:hypothetical protein
MSIEEQLKNIADNLLLKESMRLKEILDKNIIDYYSSYNPTEYKRTFDFKYSVRIKQNGASSMIVYFADENVIRDGDYLPELLNYGWGEVNQGRYHYDWYLGFHFIEKTIDEYNKSNPYGFKVILHRK